MKYPIGVQDFEKIIEDGYTYVDKTKYVYQLAHGDNIYFLNRPRRFGKSLLISTLQYYFEGRQDLFQGLAIDSLEKEWKKYPVMKISQVRIPHWRDEVRTAFFASIPYTDWLRLCLQDRHYQ